MQLKGIIKNMAAKTGIKANALLQNYMLERLLERIFVSEYKWKFILKGGMLISAIVGLDSRTTMDMDVTIKGTDFSKVTLASIKKAQDMLNDRPRKTLGFLTPHEVFGKLLH